MPLLAATGALGLGRRRWISRQQSKFEGGLNLLHEADDDAVIHVRLESTATAAIAN